MDVIGKTNLTISGMNVLNISLQQIGQESRFPLRSPPPAKQLRGKLRSRVIFVTICTSVTQFLQFVVESISGFPVILNLG
jgi:hypothetical protein